MQQVQKPEAQSVLKVWCTSRLLRDFVFIRVLCCDIVATACDASEYMCYIHYQFLSPAPRPYIYETMNINTSINLYKLDENFIPEISSVVSMLAVWLYECWSTTLALDSIISTAI